MTREEEIKQRANDISNEWVDQDYQQIAYDSAMKMAEWCDSNPHKGLVDIKKVIEWLKNHVREFGSYDSDFADVNIDVDDLIETLTKAMEE